MAVTITDCKVLSSALLTLAPQTGAASPNLGIQATSIYHRWFVIINRGSVADYGRIRNLILNMICSNVTETGGSVAGRNWCVRAVTQEIAKCTGGDPGAADMSWNYVDISATDLFDEPAVATTGLDTDPGHNTGSKVAKFANPIVQDSPTGLNYTDVVGGANVNSSGDPLDEVILEADIAARLEGSPQIVLLFYREYETEFTGSSFVRFTPFDRSPSPSMMSYSLVRAPVDEVMLKFAEVARVGSRKMRLTAVSADFAWAAGDTLTFRVSASSDMSSPTTSDPVDISEVVEDEEIAVDVTAPGSGTTVYWDVVVNVAAGSAIDYQSAASSFSLPTDTTEAPAEFLKAGHSIRRTENTADIHGVTGQAFSDGDFAWVIYGNSLDALDSASDSIALPTDYPLGFKVTATSLTITQRTYYRWVFLVDGDLYIETGHGIIQPIPASGSMTIIWRSDLHGHTMIGEDAGEFVLGGIFSNARKGPQNQRSQMHAAFCDAVLAIRAADGGYAHAQWDLGDWTQVSHQGSFNSNCFPVDRDGVPASGTNPKVLTQTDAYRMVAGVMRRDPTIRLIPLQNKLPDNHGGNHSWMYGKDWDGVVKSPEVVGRNTLDPERDIAGWHIDALKKMLGLPDGTGIYVGDEHGRWGYIDYAYMRVIWIDPYLYAILTAGDPNSLPTNFADNYDPTIGAQFDFLFNAVNGAWRTCTKRWVRLLAHNFTAGVNAAVYGSSAPAANYQWGAYKKASPFGLDPDGEWSGNAAWQSGQPHGYEAGAPGSWQEELYNLGIQKALRKYLPADCIGILMTGHRHQPMVERPHLGLLHIGVGRMAGGADDSTLPGPNSVGHRQQGGDGDHFGQPPNSHNSAEIDELFRASNTILISEVIEEFNTVFTFRKIYVDYNGQTRVNGGLVDPSDLAIGGALNPGPHATLANSIVYTLEVAHPNYPVTGFEDSFDRVLEDDVAQVVSGTEQDPLHDYMPNKAGGSGEGGVYADWKHYSSDAAKFLAVRASPIDGKTALTSKRPEAAGAGYVTQGMRRRLASINRRIRIDARVQGNPSDSIGMIGVCGADANPNFAGTAVGLGLFMVYNDTESSIWFDDGDTVELLGTPDLTSISEAFSTLTLELVGREFTVRQGADALASITLSVAQREWLDEAGNDFVSFSARTNNIEDDGFVVEWQNLDVRAALPLSGGATPPPAIAASVRRPGRRRPPPRGRR